MLGGLPLRTEIELGGGEACHDGALAGARIAARLARLVLLAEGVSSEELFLMRESPHVADRLARGRTGLAAAVAPALVPELEHVGFPCCQPSTAQGDRFGTDADQASILQLDGPDVDHILTQAEVFFTEPPRLRDAFDDWGLFNSHRMSFTPLEPSPSERGSGLHRPDGAADAGEQSIVAHGDPFRGVAPFFVNCQPPDTSCEFWEADLWRLIAKGFVKARLWIFRTDYYNIKNPFCQGC